MLIHLSHILFLASLYSLLFAFIDIYFTKWYRNLTKRDKRLTIVLKSVFVAITGYSTIIREPYLIPVLILLLNLMFDSLTGLYFYNSIYAVGKNSVLDYLGDNIDKKLDQRAKIYWFIRLVLIVVGISIYLISNTK